LRFAAAFSISTLDNRAQRVEHLDTLVCPERHLDPELQALGEVDQVRRMSLGTVSDDELVPVIPGRVVKGKTHKQIEAAHRFAALSGRTD
jgi:hypothetical protein